MYEYLNQVSEQIGIPVIFLIGIMLWSYTWKLFAFWKSARKNSPVWFIILALVNTVGILEILYIFIFSEMKTRKQKKKRR